MLALWLVSLPLKNSSIVDIFWGLGFTGVAWLSFALGHGAADRRALLAALTTGWGVRLAAYLAWRNLGRGEDPRYAAMRARHGSRWPVASLAIVFGLQGALMWLISLPLQVAAGSAAPLGPLDAAGAALVLVGVSFEATADLQLWRFKKDPANRGQVMTRGLWRYSRHPNYFGDFVVWWGLWVIAAGAGGWWTVLSPVVMSTLLMRVSGVPLLEKAMRQRPGYDEYVRRTSAFFPRPPRA